MDSISLSVGIDVSKDRLDVCIGSGKPFSVPNTPEGAERLAGLVPAGAVAFLEASGGYERAVRRVLRSHGIQVRTLDPLKVRRMAQAQGRRAKTDALDAQHLAAHGAALVALAPKSECREALAEVSRAIEKFQETVRSLKKQQLGTVDPQVRACREAVVQTILAQVRQLESAFEQAVKKSPLAERHRLARSVPGVGPVLARILVCELPEDLDAFSTSRLAAYAGLAPMDDQSGKKNAPRRIRRGCVRLKAALYMPACGLVRHQPWAKALYDKLRAKGKAHQQAAVALMRRLLVRALAVLKRGSPWTKEPEYA